jgi:penicillin-binding protein 1C
MSDGGMSDAVSPQSQSSCPGKSAKRVFAQMTRASTPLAAMDKNVDGRDKPGHDAERHFVPVT